MPDCYLNNPARVGFAAEGTPHQADPGGFSSFESGNKLGGRVKFFFTNV